MPTLRSDIAAYIDTAEPYLVLGGVERPDLVTRIKSPVFEYNLPEEDNIYQFFGFDVTGRIKPSVSDGYWFYIPPLPPGTHELTFGGDVGDPPDFALEITYTITVQ